MMSDPVSFMNSYNEVVFDNFIAVLKQNLMFQTQLKITEGQKIKIDELTKELTQKNEDAQRVGQLDTDRHRIQSALNEKSQEVTSLRAQVDILNREVGQIKTLQSDLNNLKEELEQKTKKIQILESKYNISSDSVSTKRNDDELKSLQLGSGGLF
jgi:chromosome segregation ATPase